MQMRKWRPEEVKCFVQGAIAVQRRSGKFEHRTPNPKVCVFSSVKAFQGTFYSLWDLCFIKKKSDTSYHKSVSLIPFKTCWMGRKAERIFLPNG